MKNVKRLFTEFVPEHYDLTIKPDKNNMKFSGTVVLKGKKVGKPSQRITLHQKDLTITGATAIKHDKKGDAPINFDRINHHQKFNEVRLHATHMVYPGNYTVTLHFEGLITKKMHGIYPCFFKDGDKEKIIIATQFESHHAREAFPCVDEPEAKATFDLTLHTPIDETVLANTPIAKQSAKGSQLVTTFETTPIMSTYLVAFAFGELHSVESKTKDGIIVRSWASVAQPLDNLQYSVDEGVKILEFFTDYFGVPFPLPKVDQLALPDFESGAMENWGLITYREIAMLSDPKNPSVSNEQYVSMVVAHELSHQWFGNLVTMKWWDDLWLNESFASLMEHLALDVLHPDWKQWETYTASDVIATTSRDIYSNIQPVGVEVNDPDLIHTLFDPGIVYAKGGRLLKMLREYIGDDVFAAGLQNYFKKHAYGNTTRNDLWNCLSEASSKDISALLTPWIEQSGMPILHVNQRGKELGLRQEQYLIDSDDPNDKSWPIPLLSKPSIPVEVFDTKLAKVDLKNNSFVLFNKNASGHFITHYQNPEHLQFIAQQFAEQILPIEARINILNSMYMLARIGKDSITSALDVATSNPKEDRHNVWSLISLVIGAAAQLVEDDEVRLTQVRNLKGKLADYWYKQLGWDDQEDDDVNTKELRYTMIAYKLASEDSAAIKKALALYDANKDSLGSIHADLRAIVLATAVKFGDESVVKHLITAYETSSAELQLDITSALGSTRDPNTAKEILKQAIGPHGFVRPQDLLRWVVVFIRNKYIKEATWDHVVELWDWMSEEMTHSKSFDMLPSYVAKSMGSKEWLEKYNKQFNKVDDKSMQRNIIIGRADIQARIAWRKRDQRAVNDWLDKNA